MDIKDVIKNRRSELGLTLKDIADAVGVSEATVSRWESGDIKNMKRNKIADLANVLRISPGVIMGWEEPQEHYLTPETARLAQEMFEDPDVRSFFHMKRTMNPEVFSSHFRFMKEAYRREYPEDETGC